MNGDGSHDQVAMLSRHEKILPRVHFQVSCVEVKDEGDLPKPLRSGIEWDGRPAYNSGVARPANRPQRGGGVVWFGETLCRRVVQSLSFQPACLIYE